MPLDVSVVSGVEGLMQVEDDWMALCRLPGNGGFEASFGGCLVAARHGPTMRRELRTVVVRDRAGIPLAIVPTVSGRTRVRKVPVLQVSLPPDPDRPGWGFPCALPPSWPGSASLVHALAEALAAPPALLMLGPMVEGSACWEVLQAQGVRMVESGSVRWVKTASGSGDPIDGVAGKFRRNLRRRWRILSSAGDPAFVVHRDTPRAMEALEDFLVLEQAGWKGRSEQGNAILDSPTRLARTRRIVRDLSDRNECEVHALMLQGTVIASHVCFCGSDSMYVFKTAYDESWARVSPGHLLLHQALLECMGRPDIHRLVGGAEVPWWEPWNPVTRARWQAYAPLGGLAPRLAWSLLPASLP